MAISPTPESAAAFNHGSADHFDALLNRSEEPAALATIDSEGEPAAALLGKDDFHRLFVGAFDVGAQMTALQSLKVSEADARAKAASDSLYDTMYDIPALRPLLSPSNKWYGRAFNIGFFFWCMSRAVGQELAARQLKEAEAAATSGPDIPSYNMNGKGSVQ